MCVVLRGWLPPSGPALGLTLAHTLGTLWVADVEDGSGKGKKRTTTPYMTKFERARVLGTRALQVRA